MRWLWLTLLRAYLVTRRPWVRWSSNTTLYRACKGQPTRILVSLSSVKGFPDEHTCQTMLKEIESSGKKLYGINQGSQTSRPRKSPMRPANVWRNGHFLKIFKHLTYCFNKRLEIEVLFFSLFQCGPRDRDLNLSLMRPASHSEFDTPGIKRMRLLMTRNFQELFFVMTFVLLS